MVMYGQRGEVGSVEKAVEASIEQVSLSHRGEQGPGHAVQPRATLGEAPATGATLLRVSHSNVPGCGHIYYLLEEVAAWTALYHALKQVPCGGR